VEALFRHSKLFLATAGTVLVATILITVLTPRTYQSEMNILVRNARPEYLISPERSNGQIVPADVTEERINSEIEVLRSRDVADVVVDPAWSATPAAERTEARSKAHEKSVVDFAKHLTVEPLRKSNVIHVTYVAGSPREATDTVERVLKAFLDKQHELERSTSASSFFANEASRYKSELDQAQEQLAGYQQNKQIVSLNDKETTLETQINSLEDEIRSTQVQLTEATERVASDKHQLALLPPRMPTQQRSVPNTQAVEQLTAILTNYQNKRTELLTRFQPGERLIAEVDQQIATTSAALANARATNGQESTTDVNPVYQQVKAVLATSTTDLAALRGRLSDLTVQHARLRKQLDDVEGSTVDYTTLQARVTELQNNYQLYSQKKNEAQISDAMDQQQLVNVAVAERPTFSAKTYRPQVLLNLLLGTLTAIFLGVCAVFYAELGRETISAPYDLEAISLVPVLATVPFIEETFPTFSSGRRGPGSPPSRKPSPPPGPQSPPTPDPTETSGGTGARRSTTEQRLRPSLSPDVFNASSDAHHTESSEPALTATHNCTTEEIVMMEPTTTSEPRRLDRANLLTFEQITATHSPASPTRPHSPFGEPPVALAAPASVTHTPEPAPAPVVAEVAALAPPADPPPVVHVAAPAPEPLALSSAVFDPCHRLPNHSLADSSIPTRSRLSPSQRAQLRRPAQSRDREGRLAYVTYTIDPGSRQ